jgi:non-heme chloroperoxidase
MRLPYVEQGAGVPVLLLHGITDSWRSWEPVLPHLPETIRAVAATQRGHGDAERPESGYTVEDYAADALELMDELGLETAVIVGHSMGTYVAEQIAIERPGRVGALVLVSAPGPPARNPLIAEAADAMAALEDPIDPEFVREFQSSTTERALPPGLLDIFVAESLKVPARVWRAAFAGLMEMDLSATLGGIGQPVLLVYGERDGFVTSEEKDWLLQTLRGARLVSFEGTGHAPHWEEPERFARELAAFAGAPAPSNAAP